MAQVNKQREQSQAVLGLCRVVSKEEPVEAQVNLLLTGATGLIGSAFARLLLKETSWHIYASGRNEARAQRLFREEWTNPRFHFLKHDILQPLSSDISFHYIVHAASEAAPAAFAERPVDIIRANMEGVMHLMEYGMRHDMKRFLYVSSGEVYGQGDGTPFTEEDSGYVNPMKPRSCYPSSKRAAETLCAAYAAQYGVDIVVARPCHVYGPHFTEHDNRAYAQFLRCAKEGKDIVLKSSGSQLRSWCYVEDCATALLCLLQKGKSGEAYNIADPLGKATIRQLAEYIAAAADVKVIVESMDNPEYRQSVLSTDKLCALGWNTKGTLQEKLAETLSRIMN